jgi:hypothetical protein
MAIRIPLFALSAVPLFYFEGMLQATGGFHFGIVSIYIAVGDFLIGVIFAPWIVLVPFLLIRRKRSKRPNTTS